MRSLIQQLSLRLSSFVDQRDDAALVIRCNDADAVTVLRCQENLDETSVSELHWIHAEPFESAQQYAGEVVRSFAARHEAICAAIKMKGMKRWPPMPAGPFDEALDPVQRIRELIVFSRSLLPAAEGCLSVWAFCPTRISDGPSHAVFFRSLLQHSNPFPWFHHLRFFVREDIPADLSMALQREGMPRVSFYAPDFGSAAIKQSLDEEFANPELPPGERVQALFLSAQCDYAEQKFDQAIQKHAAVIDYHVKCGNPAMTALSVQSVGEIHQRLGSHEQAARCFETAFALAGEAEQPQLPILLNALLSLANLRLGQNRLAEAETYYANAEQLATVLRNPVTKLQSLENLGYCQYAQGRPNEAIDTWKRGTEIAQTLEQPSVETSMLSRLRYHFSYMNQASEVRAIDARFAALGQHAG